MTRADQHPMWTLVWILMRIQLWIHLSGPRDDAATTSDGDDDGEDSGEDRGGDG